MRIPSGPGYVAHFARAEARACAGLDDVARAVGTVVRDLARAGVDEVLSCVIGAADDVARTDFAVEDVGGADDSERAGDELPEPPQLVAESITSTPTPAATNRPDNLAAPITAH